MEPSIDSINDPSRNPQSSTIRTQKSSNGKPVKAVVHYHPLISPPLEDWVLFPDQVIQTKHSTVRDTRARRAKKRLQPAEGRPSSVHTTEMSRATSTSSKNTSILSIEEPRDQSNSSSTLDRPDNITKSVGNVAEQSPRNPPRVKESQRLPTPDLSDVEEEGFWSCCGSSERSF